MSERDALVKKLKARLDEWDAELDKLEAKARRAEAETRARVEREIAEVRRQRRDAQAKLDEMSRAGDDAWHDLKTGAEQAWDALERSVRRAASRLSGSS